MQEIIIQTKAELKQELNKVYQAVNLFAKDLTMDDFVYLPNEKWSVANHLEHLILSSKGVASALKMPKRNFLLFGKAERDSRPYEALYQEYKKILGTGVKAPAKFCPDTDKSWAREDLLSNWQMISDKFQQRLDTWTEEDLDTYQIAHPAIGKITIRELLFSTVFHAYHHLDSMKKTISDK